MRAMSTAQEQQQQQQHNIPTDVFNENVSDKPPNKAAREYRKRMREKLIKKEEMISKLKESNQKLVNRRQMLMKALDEINKIISSNHPESFQQSNSSNSSSSNAAYEANLRAHLQRLGANMPSFLPAISQFKAPADLIRQNNMLQQQQQQRGAADPRFSSSSSLADQDSFHKHAATAERKSQVNVNLTKSLIETSGLENDAKLSVEVSPEESVDKQSLPGGTKPMPSPAATYTPPTSSLLARSHISAYNESLNEFMDVGRPINIDYFNRQAEAIQANKLFASLLGMSAAAAAAASNSSTASRFEAPSNSLNAYGMNYLNPWQSLSSSAAAAAAAAASLQNPVLSMPTFRTAPTSSADFLLTNRQAYSSSDFSRFKPDFGIYGNSRGRESLEHKMTPMMDRSSRLEFNSLFEPKAQASSNTQTRSENDLNRKKFKTPKDLWASRFESDDGK